MSYIQKTSNEARSFPESYQDMNACCMQVVQVALWGIAFAGVAAALVSRFYYFDYKFIYAGSGVASIASVIAIALLLSKRNYLKSALEDARTVEELQEVANTIQASDCNFSFLGCMIGYGHCVGANLDFIITSTKIAGTVSNSELQSTIERLLSQSTDNCKLPLDQNKKFAFNELCDLANKKCEAYTTYNNFEIPEKYLK